MKHSVSITSRFATQKESLSASFMKINRQLDQINVAYDLPDHTDFNEYRYPWSLPYLSYPEFYAARLWEYPFAFYSAEFKRGMKVLDVGCGMNPFTIFLKKQGINVLGADPDQFNKGVKYKCHGVSQEFMAKTGLTIVEAGMEALPFASNTFDRVICISVVEHVDREIAEKGMHEMARVLKPKGRLILTLDVNLLSELGQPLDLLWTSSLLPYGNLDLRWSYQRFGNFCDKLQPADVFGLVMYKDPYLIQTKYQDKKNLFEKKAWEIPKLRKQFAQRIARKQKSPQITVNAVVKKEKSGILKFLKKLFLDVFDESIPHSSNN